MNGRGPSGAVPLGTQQIEIERLHVYPAWMLDAMDGSPIPGPMNVTIRVVLPKQREALLLPCMANAARTMARNIESICDAVSHAGTAGEG